MIVEFSMLPDDSGKTAARLRFIESMREVFGLDAGDRESSAIGTLFRPD
jgi:hypothetical protein